jgi:hypothetical protein
LGTEVLPRSLFLVLVEKNGKVTTLIDYRVPKFEQLVKMVHIVLRVNKLEIESVGKLGQA